MASQQSSFQSSEFHQQQQQHHASGDDKNTSVKNLAKKFDGTSLNQGESQVESFQNSTSTVSTTTNNSSATAVGVSQAELIDFESAEEHERRARELREKALTTLKINEQEFSQAERAQEAARIAAEQANAKTSQALENQERGQQLLAEAGARLIEAGAKLQQEAAAIKREVPFNVHQQGEVRQTTCVSAAGVEAVAHAREVATFREIQPAQTTTSPSGIIGSQTSTTTNQIQGQTI